MEEAFKPPIPGIMIVIRIWRHLFWCSENVFMAFFTFSFLGIDFLVICMFNERVDIDFVCASEVHGTIRMECETFLSSASPKVKN